ncbi:MAG: dehydrogenase, partial [Chloroflexi bacterium]
MADGKVAVVTGGGRGIGRAIAVRLAQDGLHTALWARTQSEIETVASEIRDAGGEAIAILADVTDWESVR